MEDLLVQSIHWEDLTIYRNGNQTRSFYFVEELIDGLILLINSSSIGPVNLGNPEDLSVLEIANLIRKASIDQVIIKFKKKLKMIL